MKISCSRCGTDREFHYCAGNVLNTVYNLGWGSSGAALYCPECSATWNKRNEGMPLAGPENTIGLIDALYYGQRRGRRRFAPVKSARLDGGRR